MKPQSPGWIASLLLLAAAPAAADWPAMQWDPGAEQCRGHDQNRVESHAYDATTVVIRQNPCVDHEANVLYLLTGSSRALLIDTGAVEREDLAPVATTVAGILAAAGRHDLPLLVAHTHGHLDHRAGDAQFAKVSGVTIAPVESGALRRFFGFRAWPRDIVQLDLGGRVIDVIPTPGHHRDHVVFYDRNTQLLFSGDFLLPGRLLVDDLDAYRASARRVADFALSHPVRYVLGAHIELDAHGDPYSFGSTHHPSERALPLPPADLQALPAALAGFNGFYSRYPDFIVVNSIHILVALASGLLLIVTALVWLVRRLWKRRRA